MMSKNRNQATLDFEKLKPYNWLQHYKRYNWLHVLKILCEQIENIILVENRK